jgi:transaldolase
MTPSVERLTVTIFADGADLAGIVRMAANPLIQGFTTNPTLMRKAGIADYAGFAREVLGVVTDRPISFEVFSDDLAEMEVQALEIASWAPNVNVKIPVTTTTGETTGPLLRRLTRAGVKVNVTALMTVAQVNDVVSNLEGDVPAFVSVFAGRIADTGRDPVPIMSEAVAAVNGRPNTSLIWASPRELLNVFQADAIGCHIITATHDILGKLGGVGKDLTQFSLETVAMFRSDAVAAGFSISPSTRATVDRPEQDHHARNTQ